MCFAVTYKGPEEKTVYAGKNAMVPVLDADGVIESIRWGRVKSEPGRAVAHHCARIESIRAGKWKWLKPERVRILATSFLDWTVDKQQHWNTLEDNQALWGALVQDGDTPRVYVVTMPVPEEFKHLSKGGRWPKVATL